MKLIVLIPVVLTLVTGCSPSKKRDGKATFVTQGQQTKAPTVPVEVKAENNPTNTPAIEAPAATPSPAPAPTSTPVAAPAAAPTTSQVAVPAPSAAPVSAPQQQSPQKPATVGAIDSLTAPLVQAQENQKKASTLGDQDKAAKEVKTKLDAAAAEAEKNAPQTPPSEEDTVMWPKLVEYVADRGIKDESPMGFYVTLIWISNNDFRAPPHIDSRISIVGGFNDQGQFALSRMETVWADVKVNADGNTDADQWMFLTSKTGAIAKYWRYHLVKKPNATVLVHKSIDVTEAEAKAKWDELRKGWYKLIQQNPPPKFVTFE